MMKKINIANFFILLIASLNFFSCEDTLTLKSTKPSINDPSEAMLEGILTSSYNVMTVDNSMYGYGLWGATDGCDTDEMFYRDPRTDRMDIPGLHNINATILYHVQYLYRNLYEAIEHCNIVIDLADKINMDNAKRRYIVAQARVMRAYSHYLLVTHYGPVPIKIIPTEQMLNMELYRDPIAKVCDFAVNELRQAIPDLKSITETKSTARITKSVAEALSLRVGMYMASHPDIQRTEMYDSVAVWGKSFIASNIHDLNTKPLKVASSSGDLDEVPAYARLFVNNVQNKFDFDEDNKEGIWDVTYFMKGNKEQSPYQGWNGSFYNYLCTYMGIDCNDPNYTTSKVGKVNPIFKPQYTLYKKYETGDLRRDWNISTYVYNDPTYTRHYYTECKFPSEMGTPTRQAKINFTPKPSTPGGTSILLYDPIIEDGGEGYTDGTYDIEVIGYNRDWKKDGAKPAMNTGSILTATVENGLITSVELTKQVPNYVNIYTRSTGKWRREYEINYVTGAREEWNTDCFFPIIRYADVLLLTAEAALFSTKGATKADGLSYVNRIRNRAGLEDISDYDLAYIQDERARELCYEGQRRTDLLRWGYKKYKEVYDEIVADVQEFGGNKDDASISASGSNLNRPVYAIQKLMDNYEKYSLLPIPNQEISRCSNTFYQNPGW